MSDPINIRNENPFEPLQIRQIQAEITQTQASTIRTLAEAKAYDGHHIFHPKLVIEAVTAGDLSLLLTLSEEPRGDQKSVDIA